MKYFKNKTGEVYAYSEQDLEAINGIAELEQDVTSAQQDFDALVEPQEPEPIALVEGEEGYEQAQAEYDEALEAYKAERQVHDTAKNALAKNALAEAQAELDAVLPVFFDIREKLKDMTELTGAELEEHLNPTPSLDDLATYKRQEIDSARDAALHDGLPCEMPDGTQETVQIRPQDEPNLLGLAIEARDLQAEGVTDPVLVLRVESNLNYQFTPQQMIELTDAAKNHKKLILAKSWQLKDAIDAALAAEDREAIEAIKWE